MPPDPGPREARPDWLLKRGPEAWLAEGLGELSRAETRLSAHDRKAGLLGLKRAAGMALNGALSIRFRPWGRTYIEHLRAVADEQEVPPAVRDAARLLSEAEVDQQPGVVRLTPPSESARWIEAAKTVMAHAYAVVHGSVGRS